MTLTDYLNLIPAKNRNKPDFIANLSIDLEIEVRIQDLMKSLIPLFDVEVAVGEQLDFIGEWVGVTRNVPIPITGVYFTWDGVDPSLGWDYGSWQPSGSPTEVTVLPDDAYRTLIKAKIAANHWDGTTDGAYAVWEILFPQYTFLIQDHQNMSYSLAILGGIIDSLTLALIRGGQIALKPEGVRIDDYLIPIDDGPAFAWDADAPLLKGWDEGSWVQELSPT